MLFVLLLTFALFVGRAGYKVFWFVIRPASNVCPFFAGLCGRFLIFQLCLPCFFMPFKFFIVTSCTLCFSSYCFVQGCYFLPALRYRSRACSPAFANLPLGRIRFSWLGILVSVFTLSCVFIFYLFTFCSAFFVWSFAPLFVWFVYLFTYLPHCAYTINSTGAISILPVLLKIRLFAFAVPSVFQFIVPTEQFKAC